MQNQNIKNTIDNDVEALEIDFEALERSYVLSLIVKTINIGALVGLVAGMSYLIGYGAGRDAPAYPTSEQFQQHVQQLEKLEKQHKENDHDK